MKLPAPYSIGLLFFLSTLLNCQNTTKQFQQLENQIKIAEDQMPNDFSPDSTLEKAWQNGQLLKQQLAILTEKIKKKAINLPYYQLEQQLADHISGLQQLRSDASIYNLGGHLKVALSQPQQTISNKLSACESMLQLSQNYYAAAKDKLTQPNVERLNLAIRKQALGISFLNGPVQDSLALLGLDTLTNWQENTLFAQRAMKDYIAWCNSQLFDYHANENSLSNE